MQVCTLMRCSSQRFPAHLLKTPLFLADAKVATQLADPDLGQDNLIARLLVAIKPDFNMHSKIEITKLHTEKPLMDN